MAYVVDESKALPQGQPGQQQQNPQAPISAGGAGLGGPKPSASTPGQNVPAQPSAQLSAYLGANQPQAEQFGQKIASDLSGQVNAAGQAIQPAVSNFTSNIYSVPTDAALNAKVASSPSSLTPEEKTAYQTQLGAAAKAPNSANTFETTQPYQDVTAGIQKAVEQQNLWNRGNDLASISTALSPYAGQQATSGDKTLDSILLSQTPAAYSQIQQAIAPASGFQSQLDAGTTQANDALRNAIAENTKTTNMATGAAGNYASNLSDYLNNLVTQTQGKANAQIAQNGPIYSDYNSGNLTPEDAQAMGIAPEQAAAFAAAFNNINNAINAENSIANSRVRRTSISYADPTGLHPLDFSPYLTQAGPVPEINPANVASQQNYADIAALQELLGNNYNVNLPINSTTADQAGLGLNYNGSNTVNLPGLTSYLTPAQKQAQYFHDYAAADVAGNLPQTPEQASTIAQSDAGIHQIIEYLNQLAGTSGTGIAAAPAKKSGMRPI